MAILLDGCEPEAADCHSVADGAEQHRRNEVGVRQIRHGKMFCAERQVLCRTVEGVGSFGAIMELNVLKKHTAVNYMVLAAAPQPLVCGEQIYMGFMLLIIACAVLALQFLTQMRATRARYATLSILGARREQMKRSINQQVLWYFLLPMLLACLSGTVGVYAMQHYLHNAGVQKLQQSLPLLLVMGSIVVLVFVIYGVATARTANREISKLNWKPNS